MGLDSYRFESFEPEHVSHAVSALLVVCAGLILWSMLPHKIKAVAAPSQLAVPQNHVSTGFIAQQIAAAHLFGQDAASSVNSAPAATAANIIIQGLFYSEDKELARAILEVNGKSDVFKTGDRLPDGEKLAAIGVAAVQVANGPAIRVVELSQNIGNSSSDIQLAGAPGLYAQQDSFSQRLQTPLTPALPRLRPPTIPLGDPISQMQSLRQQLIGHR